MIYACAKKFFVPLTSSFAWNFASGPTAITPLMEIYQLQPTDHFESRIFQNVRKVSKEVIAMLGIVFLKQNVSNIKSKQKATRKSYVNHEPEVVEELYLWRSFRFFSRITVEMKDWEADGLCSLYTSRWLSLGFLLVTIVKIRGKELSFFFAKMADNFLCLNGFMMGDFKWISKTNSFERIPEDSCSIDDA